MAPKTKPDPRNVVGADVHARAASVLRSNENKRIHGAEAGTKLLDGVVQAIKEERSSNGRRLVYIEIEFTYGDGAMKKRRHCTTVKWLLVEPLLQRTSMF